MEPVTHLLTGACLSRTGLNRRAAYATLTMVVAAEFPDIDMLWAVRGPVEGLEHHRGITHALLGLPFEAALVVGVVYAWHRWRMARASAAANTTILSRRRAQGQDDGEKPAMANAKEEADPYGMTTRKARATATTTGAAAKPLTVAPVRWGMLYGLALVALLSHLLLDYTNNYGLRPFFPFNDRWYAASIVFVFDPVMFAMLLGALVAPLLFGLVSAEVGAKKQPFVARAWAIAALLGVVAWWGLRTVEHARAVQMAMGQSITAPAESVGAPPGSESPDLGHPDLAAGEMAPVEAVPVYLQAQRALASPEMLSPFRWSAAMDFGPVYQLAEMDTLGGTVTLGQTTYPKPGRSAAVLAAEGSKLGRVYMDWSPMPIVQVTGPESGSDSGPKAGGDEAVDKVVTFRDSRFMSGWLGDGGRQPLMGTVELDAAGRVVRQTLDGRVEP
jgi:inner membrane protein